MSQCIDGKGGQYTYRVALRLIALPVWRFREAGMLVMLAIMMIVLVAPAMLLSALNVVFSLKSLCPSVKCSLITVVVLISKVLIVLFGFLICLVVVDAVGCYDKF
jgi:hypothetical protein